MLTLMGTARGGGNRERSREKRRDKSKCKS